MLKVVHMRTQVRRPVDGGVVVSIAGTFNATDADQLRSVTEGLCASSLVTLDFHEVEELSDFALAKLAAELPRTHGQFALAGLSEHHYRMLRLLRYIEAVGPHSADSVAR